MKEVILARHSGFCFGVERAVNMAESLREKYSEQNIYTLGPIIHNKNVVEKLKDKKIYTILENEFYKLKPSDIVIIRSHGISKATYEKLESLNVTIENATCPYVLNIQRKVNKYYEDGYKILIVGDKDHAEVIGINGWCENSALIYKNGNEIQEDLPKKLCVVSQTTEKQANYRSVINVVADKCKEFIAINTICNATEQRQVSAIELSKNVTAMIIIGGKNSSNTTKLYELCAENCKHVYHIEDETELTDEILNLNTNKIGLTAGASTPEWIIKNVIYKLENS